MFSRLGSVVLLWLAFGSAAVLYAQAAPGTVAAPGAEDGRLKAIYTAEDAWRRALLRIAYPARARVDERVGVEA